MKSIVAEAAAEPHAAELALSDRWLVVRFAERHVALSWAVVGGGRQTVDAVAWHQVFNRELCPATDPRELLRERMRDAGIADAVGLLTSASLASYTDVAHAAEGVSARCIATVGLGNALRAGDPPGAGSTLGTINLLVHLSVPLTEEARLEALALAAEARSLAMREAEVASLRSGLPATGTGTDCIVVAAPERGSALAYAGKHTAAGYVVGRAVEEAVRLGIGRWRSEQARAWEAAAIPGPTRCALREVPATSPSVSPSPNARSSPAAS